jgi:hypothetical protein
VDDEPSNRTAAAGQRGAAVLAGRALCRLEPGKSVFAAALAAEQEASLVSIETVARDDEQVRG